MISLALFGLIYAIVLNLAEAKIDSLEKLPNGEPHDYNKKSEPVFSFSMYFLYPLAMCSASQEFSVYKLIFLWFGVRGLFDLMYNYYRGFHWSYLGTTAKTDGILKKINPYLLLLARVSILIITIIFSVC